MKFLAILRDSLRETLDVKLFYVLVALSLMVVLLVASISYKPVPMERQLRFIMDLLNLNNRAEMQNKPEYQGLDMRQDMEDFRQLNDRPEPWLGDYSVVFTFTISEREQQDMLKRPTKEEFDRARKQLQERITTGGLQRDLKNIFVEVEVTEVQTEDPNQQRFQVTTSKGTRIKSRHEWFHEPALFFGAVPIPVPLFSLSRQVEFIGDDIIGAWGAAVTMLLSTILTASFIPSMLSKGTIDLLLAKPIHRVTLLVYKFLGGLLFMFLNTVVIMAGIWASIGLQSGLWITSFLLCIPIFTFQFAIFYSVSALVAVLTRSAIVSILAVVMMWGTLVLLGWTHWFFIEKGRVDKPASTTGHWAYVGYDIVKTVFPRYKDTDWLTSRMIKEELMKPRTQPAADGGDAREQEARKIRERMAEEVYKKQLKELEKDYGAFSWTSSLTVSSIFILAMLGLACLRFATKDY